MTTIIVLAAVAAWAAIVCMTLAALHNAANIDNTEDDLMAVADAVQADPVSEFDRRFLKSCGVAW